MRTTVINLIGPKECPYTFNGVNLSEMRRSELFQIAKAFDMADPQWSKNELLTGLISQLRLMNSEREITDLIEE